MQTLTEVGVLSQSTINAINANFAEVSGAGSNTSEPTVWVRPQAGVGNADGSYERPFGSMALAQPYMVPGAVIGLEGVLLEEFTAPLGINNVTIVGASQVPRQATTSGVPNGGGATWLSPSGGTSWLLRLRAQGWTIANIYFNNSATAAPCVSIFTDGDPPTQSDAAHALFYNCIFTGTDDGVNVNGGTNFVRFVGCTFFGFSGSGDLAVSSTGGAGVGTLLDWRFLGCKFFNNAGNITAGLSHATIQGCVFENGSASNINLTGGTAPNFVVGNYFNIAAADFDPAGGTTGVTGDVWSNTLTDAIETGLPAN
jgi:hypothetical protein